MKPGQSVEGRATAIALAFGLPPHQRDAIEAALRAYGASERAAGERQALERAIDSLHGYYKGKALCTACDHAVQLLRALLPDPEGKSE